MLLQRGAWPCGDARLPCIDLPSAERNNVRDRLRRVAQSAAQLVAASDLHAATAAQCDRACLRQRIAARFMAARNDRIDDGRESLHDVAIDEESGARADLVEQREPRCDVDFHKRRQPIPLRTHHRSRERSILEPLLDRDREPERRALVAFARVGHESRIAQAASISAMVFGAAAVNTSRPFAVTSTSSSMRMPMPRYFAGTFLSLASK